jgi:acyl carrier protein
MNGLNDKLIEIVLKISKKYDDAANINMYSNLKDDLDFDSLDEVEFIMDLENAFDIHIPDAFAEEIVDKIQCLNDLLPILKDKYDIYDIKAERKEKIVKIAKK